MLNFVALMETSLGFRLETISQPDYDSAVELAYRLGERFGDVTSVVVATLEEFHDELGFIYDDLADLPAYPPARRAVHLHEIKEAAQQTLAGRAAAARREALRRDYD